MQLPERDKLSFSYRQMMSRLAVMMGGRVAEELIFGKDAITSGASSDIEQATRLARAMVTRWGFSDELGTVAYGDNQEEVFLGHSVTRTQNVSEQTAQLIDAEVRTIVTVGYDRAKQVLTDNIDQLHNLAAALLELETLTGDEIKKVMAGEPIERGTGNGTAIARPSSGVSAIPKSGRRGGFGEPAPAPQA